MSEAECLNEKVKRKVPAGIESKVESRKGGKGPEKFVEDFLMLMVIIGGEVDEESDNDNDFIN